MKLAKDSFFSQRDCQDVMFYVYLMLIFLDSSNVIILCILA